MKSSETQIFDWPSSTTEKINGVLFWIPAFISGVESPKLSASNMELQEEVESFKEHYMKFSSPSEIMDEAVLVAETISSSAIENIYTTEELVCETESGGDSDIRTEEALNKLLSLRLINEHSGTISIPHILEYHSLIAAKETFAGEIRNDPNMVSLVGGHANPPPNRIPDLLEDWLELANRTDISIAAKIALSHCQFESIHPFIDGNGRTGRTLIQRQLKENGYRHLPLSCAYYAEQSQYYITFDKYKHGNIQPIIEFHSNAVISAHVALVDIEKECNEASRSDIPEIARKLQTETSANMVNLCAHMVSEEFREYFYNFPF